MKKKNINRNTTKRKECCSLARLSFDINDIINSNRLEVMKDISQSPDILSVLVKEKRNDQVKDNHGPQRNKNMRTILY